MALGLDGRPSDEVLAAIERERVARAQRAAQVTGPQKKFNDAALAVQAVIRQMELFWNSTGHDGKPVEDRIASLEKAARPLPSAETDLVYAFIDTVRAHIKLEQDVGKLVKDAREHQNGIAVLMNIELPAAFGLASKRGEFHRLYENTRQQLESRALAL